MPPSPKVLPALSLESLYPPNLQHDYFAGAQHLPFVPDAGASSASNRWWLAEHALLAYADDAFVRSRLQPLGFHCQFVHDPASSGFAYIARVADYCVLALRGTEVFKGGDAWPKLGSVVRDWRTDANLRRVGWGGAGKLHGGFLTAVEALWPQLQPHIDPQLPWYCCGHSLGGALAVLAALKLREAQVQATSLVSFGQPRLGDAPWAAGLTGLDYARVVNQRDLVPGLPPEALGYRHAGALIELPEAPITAVKLKLDNLLSHGLAGLTPGGLVDHAPLHYAIKCWNAALG